MEKNELCAQLQSDLANVMVIERSQTREYILQISLNMKFKHRQNESKMMDIKRGVSCGRVSCLGRGMREPYGVVGCSIHWSGW